MEKRQQAVDDKVNSLEMNGRKNKIVIFRILVSKGGGVRFMWTWI